MSERSTATLDRVAKLSLTLNTRKTQFIVITKSRQESLMVHTEQ